MAQSPTRLSENAQKSLVSFVKHALEENKKRNDVIEKMVKIDMAYARYVQSVEQGGVDPVAANIECGTLKDFTAPIVVSQVDSHVAYLADVYCSGYPLFPVASTPSTQKEAVKLQSIIDTHAVLGGYPRQLLKFFRNCVKYNRAGIEVDWCPIDRYTVLDTLLKPSEGSSVKKQQDFYSRLTSIDAYNLILDPRCEEPADVPIYGEFIGYVSLLSRMNLIKQLQYLESTEFGYNTTQALHTSIGMGGGDPMPSFSGLYYREKPQISDIITLRSFRDYYDFDWSRWMNSIPQKGGRPVKGMYEVATLYARIIPVEHGIFSPNKDIPQIYKLQVVNNEKLICARRIITAYDILPILVGQPFEDGFADQTQSTAEMQIGYQDLVSKLINIRIHAARRAVSDRAIYDPKMIEFSDANNPHPAAKLPIKPNSRLGGKGLEDAYKAIPYDDTGTRSVIQDAALIMDMSGKQSGLNKPQTGEFQKGNKSVQEWQDTMAASDNRLRLSPMTLESQVMMPLKEQLKLNIFQYGPTGIFQDMKKNETVEITAQDIDALRKTVLYFKVADGYLPISKLAATNVLEKAFVLIGNSPLLQQAYGPSLPAMFAHLMQLQGVQGLEEYNPTPQQAQTNIATAQAAQQGAPANGATPTQ